MKAYDEKLKSSLVEAMKLDNARLEEEMKHCEPHVFSEDFERRMEKLLTVHRRKNKFRTCFRYIAAAVLVLLLAGGILFIGSEDLRASQMSIDILEWLDEFFTVEDGIDDRSDSGVLFDESRIGYLPEGFEKVEEGSTFSVVYLAYENGVGDKIILRVSRDKITLNIDNEEIEKNVLINEAGYEYTRTHKEEGFRDIVMWKDENDIYYYLASTLENDEIIDVMNNISY